MLMQPWIKVMYCSLLWLTLHIRVGINVSHLSIPGIVAHGRCYISHCLLFLFFFSLGCCFKLFCRVVLVFFKCVINLTSSLFKSKVISFPICYSAHLLRHYYYYYSYYFHYCFIDFYFLLHVLFCYYFSFSLFSNAKISLILLLPLSSLSIF